jgi:hypothetical protein
MKGETRAMRDERERRDVRDGREHRVRHQPMCDDQVRRSENLELQTSNPRPARSSRQSRSAILRGESPLVPDVQTIEVLLCRNGFSAACSRPVQDMSHRISTLTRTIHEYLLRRPYLQEAPAGFGLERLATAFHE